MDQTLNAALLTQSEIVTQDPAVHEELCPQLSQFCDRHGNLCKVSRIYFISGGGSEQSSMLKIWSSILKHILIAMKNK